MNQHVVLLLLMFFAMVPPVLTNKAHANASLVKADREVQEKICADRNVNLITEFRLPGEPSYWIKPLEMNNKLFFTAVVDLKPVIIEAKTGKILPLKGTQDPLASFDGQIFTVLDGKDGHFKINFYAPSESANKIDMRKYKLNLKVFGAYQSIAPVKEKNGGNSYRLLLDKFESDGSGVTAPSILDFEKTQDGQLKIKKQFRALCPGKKLQTPFISRDGQMFAALNLETQTTQIFDISEDKCTLKNDLGFMTGKADFNPEGTQIVFHLTGTDVSSDRQGWIRNLRDETWSNIFVYDISSKKIKPITQNHSMNSYYPVFLNDGSIMHINSKQKSSEKIEYSVGISKNPMIEDSATEGTLCAKCTVPEIAGKLAVGQLLYGICSEQPPARDTIDANSLIVKVSDLSKENCRDIVSRYWSNEVQNLLDVRLRVNYRGRLKEKDMLKLKKEDLLAACK